MYLLKAFTKEYIITSAYENIASSVKNLSGSWFNVIILTNDKMNYLLL